MARIRTIKPEFTQHDELSELPAETHLFAAGLLCHCDDEGFFNANPTLLKSQVFPLRECSLSIHEMLTQLVNLGYVRLGTAANRRRYGQVTKFLDHQVVNRPTPSKIKDLHIVWDSSVSLHGNLMAGSPPERKGMELERNRERNGDGPAVTVQRQPVIILPLNDGSEYAVSEAQAGEWVTLYPSVDVQQQLRHMRGWLLSNEGKRKTRRGILTFITDWLAREQNKPTAQKRESSNYGKPTGRNNGFHDDGNHDRYSSGADFVFDNRT